MSENATRVESRIRTLELRLAYLSGAAFVGAVAVLGFMGWTSFKTIPNAVQEQIGTETLSRIKAVAEQVDDISNVSALQSQIEELRESYGLCEDPRTECACKLDGGSDRAKIILCMSRCPDGRIAGFEIRTIQATSSGVTCDGIPASRSWQ